jgi:hypothetical protein
VLNEAGCRELVLAVIDQAVEDARGTYGVAEMGPARAWLFQEDPDEPPRSLAWYCRLLGMDPARARAMLLRRLELQGIRGQGWRPHLLA